MRAMSRIDRHARLPYSRARGFALGIARIRVVEVRPKNMAGHHIGVGLAARFLTRQDACKPVQLAPIRRLKAFVPSGKLLRREPQEDGVRAILPVGRQGLAAEDQEEPGGANFNRASEDSPCLPARTRRSMVLPLSER